MPLTTIVEFTPMKDPTLAKYVAGSLDRRVTETSICVLNIPNSMANVLMKNKLFCQFQDPDVPLLNVLS